MDLHELEAIALANAFAISRGVSAEFQNIFGPPDGTKVWFEIEHPQVHVLFWR